ncbi:putative metalloprotease with PDZ domain [Lewinella aquimaris]|uniref:Putative metalloprotease with PDZ domain n=1 Tax=Neolewinella aquimaris TaxID=1835722 RepID=A0A840DZH8_9BACT|nr:M61 family metallopeptidase [Neolewinella aquimaris]MBB4078401.1 putative metalloprotease with PDZ domain [Neolewinella aquimaris]
MRHVLSFLFLLSSTLLCAQLEWVAEHPGTIVYDLDLSRVQQHELRITVTFPAVPSGVFFVRMPQASPGRYAQHNFAKNVYDVSASAGGEQLRVDRIDPDTWAVTGHDGRVTFRYTLFANDGDGTYSGIDGRKLHLNMPASFPYGDRLNDRPVMVRLAADQQPEWEVATQLVNLGDRRFAAPNYYYFYDSPMMVGRMMRDEFTVTSGERVDTIEVAMMHEGSRQAFDAYVAWTDSVVHAQQRVFGELPAFDYGRYVFLCSYNPWISGDGMEHRNSTICSAPIGLEGNERRLIGTVSHEFFHCWNVERIRPATLEPFSFDHVNMSGELWFAEGFTSYYDDLALVRGGILDPADYAAGIAGPLNYVINRPGRNHRSPIEMSQQAPFVDAATANDPDNFDNTFVSYYTYGTVLALGLDLELRQRDHTLDELMRLMWRRYGIPEIPYHVRDIQLALAEVSQDSSFAAAWFADHVYDSKLPDFSALLRPYGIDLLQARPDSVGFFALRLKDGEEGPVVAAPVFETNPLFDAGLDRGSIILSLNGTQVTTVGEWTDIVGRLEAGKSYTIGFRQLGEDRTGTFTAGTDPTFVSSLNGERDAKTSELRKQWLGR